MTKLPSAWKISDRDYPEEAASQEQLRFLIGYAILAPSCRNSQPWLFRLGDETVEVLGDPQRLLEACDPAGRERAISCGSALYNLRLAVRHFGRSESVQVTPPEAPGVLARLHREGSCPKASEPGLFEAIAKRRSWRRPFAQQELPADLVPTLDRIARSEGAHLTPVTVPSLQQALAGLVAEADWRLGADAAIRREAASWIRGTESSGDGVPARALEMGPVESILAPVTHRVFNYSEIRANRDRERACEAPLIVALSTEGDEPADWLASGQAAQKVLLHAVAEGMQTSFLNPPIQVPELRERLRALLGLETWPQVLIRFGYPTGPARPTPRRPLEDVLQGPG